MRAAGGEAEGGIGGEIGCVFTLLVRGCGPIKWKESAGRYIFAL